MYECNIAEKLIELRTAKGVTQEDVANALAVSNKTISKWENGASAPDLPMLIELSKYYNVSTDVLLGIAMEEKQTTESFCYQSEIILKAKSFFPMIHPIRRCPSRKDPARSVHFRCN